MLVMPRALLPLFAAGLLVACSGGPRELEVVVGEAATERTVRVAPEQAFVVIVGTNASIGWTWDLTVEPDTAVAEFVDRRYVPDEPVQPGSGGVDRFRFRAVGAGQTSLRLSRDFRGEGPDRQLTITVVVRAS